MKHIDLTCRFSEAVCVTRGRNVNVTKCVPEVQGTHTNSVYIKREIFIDQRACDHTIIGKDCLLHTCVLSLLHPYVVCLSSTKAKSSPNIVLDCSKHSGCIKFF